jgi:hypothetical protein
VTSVAPDGFHPALSVRSCSNAICNATIFRGLAAGEEVSVERKGNRIFLIVGGKCAITWPLLSELAFYASYPLLAGADRIPVGADGAEILAGAAALGNNRAIVALEWLRVASPLLLLMFFSALFNLLRRRESSGLA